LHLVHELEPSLPVIVRTYDDSDLEKLQAAGAAEVVPEIIEGSLMLASHALVLLGVPLNRVVRRIRDARDSRYQMLRGFFHGADDEIGDHADASHVRLHSVTIPEKGAAVGQALGSLDIAALGVEVTAMRRRGIRSIDPGPEAVLAAGDTLVLRGTASALELAEQALLGC
jgi:monovalent cation:H+ antiporter-2, CPA2 family